LDLIDDDGFVKGWAWNEHDPSRAVQVAIHIDGSRVALVTPRNFRADLVVAGISHGCFAFSWRIPDTLRDGSQHELRAFNLDVGEELLASPANFLLQNGDAAVATENTGLFVNPRLDVWPSGLSGALGGRTTEIAPGVVIGFAEDDAKGQYQVIAPHFPGGDAAPYYGVQLVNGTSHPCWLYQSLAEGARAPLASGMQLSVELSLGAASEPLTQRIAHVALIHRTKDGYQKLRTLAKGRVFRQPTLLTFQLRLTDDELKLLANRVLSLGIQVDNAPVLRAYPFQLVRVDTHRRGGLVGFEDDRLVMAFAACGELAQASGRHAAFARLLQADNDIAPAPCNPAPEDPSTRPARTLAHMRYPFTQIIVPAYNGDAVVMDCLRSLQENTHTPFQCLIINDGSRLHTSEMLSDLVSRDPRFIIHDREVNRGYTKSINEAVMLAGASWVVILNSDTLVSRDWLARLHDAAASYPNTGMVGPLSNAATYQSVPKLREADGGWSRNDFIKPADLPLVQEILEQHTERAYPAVPLLNGFCTLISKEVFDRCGLFDEDAFPIGYGEETDLCLRAEKAGFRLVVADDCFIYHHKSVTFGAAGRKSFSRAGNSELLNKHVGVNLAELERQMHDNSVLVRLREAMSGLRLGLG
jgi:GT2 family glycosyltransferase